MYATITISFTLLVFAVAQEGLTPLRDGRIVGGVDTSIEKHPYQISLRQAHVFRCGGSIINEKMVVTAAHCVRDITVNLLTIRAGVTCMDDLLHITERRVFKLHIHDKYDSDTTDNDIAILVLLLKLPFNTNRIKPIAMVGNGLIRGAGGVYLYVTGYGRTEDGNISNCLKVAEVRIVDREACRAAYGKGEITDNMICAGTEEGVDSCQGDSGGPLIAYITRNNVIVKVLIGVVSWGNGCGTKGFPGVYTDVSRMRPWIDSIIKMYI